MSSFVFNAKNQRSEFCPPVPPDGEKFHCLPADGQRIVVNKFILCKRDVYCILDVFNHAINGRLRFASLCRGVSIDDAAECPVRFSPRI